MLVGFDVQRVVTTAATAVGTAGETQWIVARLKAGGDAATLTIYKNNSTAAANKVSILTAAATGADEQGYPIRCGGGCKVVLSVNTAEGFVGYR